MWSLGISTSEPIWVFLVQGLGVCVVGLKRFLRGVRLLLVRRFGISGVDFGTSGVEFSIRAVESGYFSCVVCNF